MKDQFGREVRTDLVSVPNYPGKDTIHRAECGFARRARRVDLLPRHVGTTGSKSHRVYRTCGSCLKGFSTFRLPAESAS